MAFILLFFGSLLTEASPQCIRLAVQLRETDEALSKYIRLKSDLQAQFRQSVEADLTAKSEGLLDEIHRNTAIKAIHAKNRLNHTIEEKQLSRSQIIKQYCMTCAGVEPAPEYCEICREVQLCKEN